MPFSSPLSLRRLMFRFSVQRLNTLSRIAGLNLPSGEPHVIVNQFPERISSSSEDNERPLRDRKPTDYRCSISMVIRSVFVCPGQLRERALRPMATRAFQRKLLNDPDSRPQTRPDCRGGHYPNGPRVRARGTPGRERLIGSLESSGVDFIRI
jgi:hypothetical protein